MCRCSEQAQHSRGKPFTTRGVQGRGQQVRRLNAANNKAASEHGLATPQALDVEGAPWQVRTIMYLSAYFQSQHFPDRLLSTPGGGRGCHKS